MATAPGKSHREGVTMMGMSDLFPTDKEAREWFESLVWAKGRHCPRCGNAETVECHGPSHPMPYRCYSCNRYFSVRIGTVMERSPLSFRKWVWAIYLHLTSLKGVSSMKLHRDIGVTQKTAWFMLQRIRKAFERDDDDGPSFGGPTEIDETYIGGLRKNMSKSKRKALEGRGPAGKAAVVGAKDRETGKVAAKHVAHTDAPHLAGFAAEHAKPGTTIYTDEASAYNALNQWFDHEAVNHGAGEYVRGMAHTNGVESFWSMLKRGYIGIYHKMSPKHLQRYVCEYAGRHNIRQNDTMAQMAHLAEGMIGKRLTYAMLIADNRLPSGARG